MKRNLTILLMILIGLTFLYLLRIVFYQQRKVDDDLKDLSLSAWLVYWDKEDVSVEIDYMKESLEEICYFAAYFDENNQLFIPEYISNLHLSLKPSLADKDIIHYLSVVNDKINKEGTSSLKDQVLLYDLLANKEDRQSHIGHLVNLCLENGYDGLEIDYEGFKNDEILWGYFLEFNESLYEELSTHDLKMRVVLEPSAPVENYSFPKGPTYVIMCYNLYGTHSGPGPKADRAFLESLSSKMDVLPGEPNFALATGGFDWEGNGSVIAITEKRAKELMEMYEVEAIRDDESYSLVFKYIDENGIEHEVWFADGTTLSSWINILKNKGNKNFSMWRLNGNKKESLIIIDSIDK